MRDKNELKQSLTTENIESVLKYYNADYFYNQKGELQIETLCHNRHGGSHKLYCYEGEHGHSFHCYTHCGSFDIFELIIKISETRGETIDFKEAMRTLGVILNINIHGRTKKKIGFGSQFSAINDWDFIEKLKKRKIHQPQFESIDENVLSDFKRWYIGAWYDEGISMDTQDKFGIRFNPEHNQAVLPHRDPSGKLIGIRVRNFRDSLLSNGKYKPLYHNGKQYNHPIGYSIYGLYENKEAIKRKKKVVITEGEKSAMLAHSMFGDDNFVVSMSGSNLNYYQADLIMKLGVDEVVIGIDQDWLFEPTEEYYTKLKRIAKHFINKVNVYHLTDVNYILDAHDNFLDKGKDNAIRIMKESKHQIFTLDDLKVKG